MMNGDLISRSEAIEALLKQPNTPTPSVIRRVLRQVPGVDAVEVVRCKDCVRSNTCVDARINGEIWICYISNIVVHKNHFCGYGERREENAAD